MRNTYAKCAEALGCVAVLIAGCASAPPAPPPAEVEAVAGAPLEPVVPERAAQEFAKAVAMLEAGRTTDAELELKQLALAYPEFPGPYFNLGLLYERAGKLPEAQQALQEALKLPDPPRIIEGFDIAHLQGSEMVGSMVCFIDGVPFKNGYRRYKIKHGQGNNDFLSLQEVVSRRYREAGANNELYPNLILIDGGIGQLHAAMDAFKLMDIQPPAVISLAKKEELIYTNASSQPCP